MAGVCALLLQLTDRDPSYHKRPRDSSRGGIATRCITLPVCSSSPLRPRPVCGRLSLKRRRSPYNRIACKACGSARAPRLTPSDNSKPPPGASDDFTPAPAASLPAPSSIPGTAAYCPLWFAYGFNAPGQFQEARPPGVGRSDSGFRPLCAGRNTRPSETAVPSTPTGAAEEDCRPFVCFPANGTERGFALASDPSAGLLFSTAFGKVGLKHAADLGSLRFVQCSGAEHEPSRQLVCVYGITAGENAGGRIGSVVSGRRIRTYGIVQRFCKPQVDGSSPSGGCLAVRVAVGPRVSPGPPHRSVRAELPHTAPTSGAWRRIARWDADTVSGHWGSICRRAG